MSDLWAWLVFGAIVVAMLGLDLAFFGRRAEEIALRTALAWSIAWTAIGLGFVGVVGWLRGGTAAEEYLTGFVLEKSLSIDNLFVFALILSHFAVPLGLQRRVIFAGIVGAIVLRGVFIVAGSALLDAFHWMAYAFGAFLVLTAIRMAREPEVEIDPGHTPALRALRRILPLTSEYHGERFVVRKDGTRMATPLVAAFVVVATFDVVFAVDSIPAIFAVTRDTFVVYGANAMSLLGLTALYFLLLGMIRRFRYLNVGLAVVLAFVGVKMLIADLYEVPILISLAVVVAVLASSIGVSLRATRGDAPAPSPRLGDA